MFRLWNLPVKRKWELNSKSINKEKWLVCQAGACLNRQLSELVFSKHKGELFFLQDLWERFINECIKTTIVLKEVVQLQGNTAVTDSLKQGEGKQMAKLDKDVDCRRGNWTYCFRYDTVLMCLPVLAYKSL